MTDRNYSTPPARRILSGRRAVLLASAACLAIAAILAGPTIFRQLDLRDWPSSAHATEIAQRQPGFADLVAKVKPAVISRDLAKKIAAMAPGTSVKLNTLRAGHKTVFLTFGQLPNEHQAQVISKENKTRWSGVPKLWLSLAPAGMYLVLAAKASQSPPSTLTVLRTQMAYKPAT